MNIWLFYHYSQFTEDSLKELEKFNHQKAGDFRSMLINYVQLQMHMHRKVGKDLMRLWNFINKSVSLVKDKYTTTNKSHVECIPCNNFVLQSCLNVALCMVAFTLTELLLLINIILWLVPKFSVCGLTVLKYWLNCQARIYFKVYLT